MVAWTKNPLRHNGLHFVSTKKIREIVVSLRSVTSQLYENSCEKVLPDYNFRKIKEPNDFLPTMVNGL